MKLNEWIKKRLNGNQAEFSRLIGVSRAAVSLYCLGKRQPTKEIAEKIAKVTKGEVKFDNT